jgi:hypothetical protein
VYGTTQLTDWLRDWRANPRKEAIFCDCFDGAQGSQSFFAAEAAVAGGFDASERHGLIQIEHALSRQLSRRISIIIAGST